MSRLLAIDPGTKASGYALFDDGHLIEAGAITASRLGLMTKKVYMWFNVREVLIDRLVIERSPPTSRAKNPADLFMPGVAAGIWAMAWYQWHSVDPQPELVKVADWRNAIIGPKRRRPLPDPKDCALLVAQDEWRSCGIVPACPAGALKDAAEATCIGLYALSVTP